MVSGRILLTAVALAASVPILAAPPHGKRAAPAPKPAPTAAEQLIRNCNAHKFETVVHEMVDGQPHQSKVKLCGKEGQTDSEWIGTLKDAAAKLASNKQMNAEARNQIIAALNSEIAKLENRPVEGLLPTARSAQRSPLDNLAPLPPLPQSKGGTASLPPLPQPQIATASPSPVPVSPGVTASLPPPRQIQRTAPQDEYAALPPLPTAPVAPAHVLAGGVSASAPMLPRPRLTLTCYTPGDVEGPCTGFSRDTSVTVHAGEDLPAGTALRFVRDGDPRADVDLVQLKKGKSQRFVIPADLCRHVVGGKLELRILRSGQEVGTEGPYNLSC